MDIKETAADVIVVKQFEKPKETPGGIVLPQNVTAEANSDKIGVVCNIGSDIDCVEIGDIVAFSHNFAQAVNLGKKIRIFLKKENILAILED